jgi:hypothetical protein
MRLITNSTGFAQLAHDRRWGGPRHGAELNGLRRHEIPPFDTG